MTARNSQFKKSLAPNTPQNGLSSAPISWTLAEELHQEYTQNPDALKIETPSGVQVLNGFRINANHMRNILDGKNESGVVVQSPASDVFIMLGVREEDLGKPVNEQFFTLIVTSLDHTHTIQTEVVYDHGSPCPDSCPNMPSE